MKTKVVRLTNKQYLEATDVLRNNAEHVMANIHSYPDLQGYLKTKLDFEISPNTLPELVDSASIQMTFKRKGNNGNGPRNVTKVLAKALFTLYKKLGETPPSDLVELFHRTHGSLGMSDKLQAPPIPVKSVIDPKTLNVVGGQTK